MWATVVLERKTASSRHPVDEWGNVTWEDPEGYTPGGGQPFGEDSYRELGERPFHRATPQEHSLSYKEPYRPDPNNPDLFRTNNKRPYGRGGELASHSD